MSKQLRAADSKGAALPEAALNPGLQLPGVQLGCSCQGFSGLLEPGSSFLNHFPLRRFMCAAVPFFRGQQVQYIHDH